MAVLQYYFVKKGVIEHVIFNKYTIDNGIIKNAKGESKAYHKNKVGYNTCHVQDDNGKQRGIYVGRAIASTIHGPPPTPAHTADHEDRNCDNDTNDNIRWLCKPGQQDNRSMPETYRSAFVVIKDGIEKTANEWVTYLKDQKNYLDREYTNNMITKYAQKKQHGFYYKEYTDLPDEIWKEVTNSSTKQGHWEISNMNRVKYITKHAENILSGDRLALYKGYPNVYFNKKKWFCHILAFMTFFPEEYANKKSNEMILHEDDDPLDFRPHKLRLGTRSDNGKDAHNNGKYDNTKTAKMKCVSYINGIYEIMHDSQGDAAKYLRYIGYKKASNDKISSALSNKCKSNFAYDRTWQKL